MSNNRSAVGDSAVADISLSLLTISRKNEHSLWERLSRKVGLIFVNLLDTQQRRWNPYFIAYHGNYKQDVSSDNATPLNTIISGTSIFDTLTGELDLSSRCVNFWWHSTAYHLARMLEQARYPAAFQRSILLLFYQQIIPQLGPGADKNRESFMTDDGGPLESSCVADGSGKMIVRFAIDPFVPRDASKRSQSNRKSYVAQLLAHPIISANADMEWFNIFSEALTLEDGKEPSTNLPASRSSEFFLGLDCKVRGVVVKAYFIPELRSMSSGVSKERMIGDVLHRVGLDKPWSLMTKFFSTLETQPDLFVVAIDCAPSQVNRVKIYVRLELVTYANLEKFMTLGGALESLTGLTTGLHALRRAWQLLFGIDPISQANDSPRSHNPEHFASALSIYYELTPNHSMPYPKAYFPIRHYAANDKEIALKMASLFRELGNSSIAESYVENIESSFPHRPLSLRTGIQTYVSCAIKATKVEIGSYFNPEAYAPERCLPSSHRSVLRGVSSGESGIPSDDAEASAWVQKLASVMRDPSIPLETVFVADSVWRDLLALSSDFRTLEGIDKIRRFLSSNIPTHTPFNLQFLHDARIKRITPSLQILQGCITFETITSCCTGVFTLLRRNEGGTWNGWTMVATVERLKGSRDAFMDPLILKQPPRHVHQFGRPQSSNVDVVIIGGGQAGLATAARLKSLGVQTLIVERDGRIGNSWRSRYSSLKCNTPKNFSQMPFTGFPSDWPMFPQGTQVADFLQRYPDMTALNISTSTSLLRAAFEKKSWKLRLQSDGGEWDISTRHLVLATGDLLGSIRPKMPSWTRMSDFKGTILHSTDIRDLAAFAGKRTVVVGSGCSGHDIAQALWECGAASVTLVQRSDTAVVSEELLLMCFPDLYTGKNALPVDMADRLYLAFPGGAGKVVRHAVMQNIAAIDEHLLNGLRSRGFLLPCDKDAFLDRLLVRRGGYYINHGCSELIIDGKILIKSGQGVESLSASSIHFADGSSVNADLIVCATGFESSHNPGPILGHAISSKLVKVGTWDDEGEVAGIWRPSGQERLWFAGGDLFTSRFYSRLLALQITGVEAGLMDGGEKLSVLNIPYSPNRKLLGWLFGIVILFIAYHLLSSHARVGAKVGTEWKIM